MVLVEGNGAQNAALVTPGSWPSLPASPSPSSPVRNTTLSHLYIWDTDPSFA